MIQSIFYKIFNDFLIKNEISPSSNFESVKKEWIPFFHTHEKQIQECICGHKVKYITYYFNIIHKTVIFIGTSCCKKYGFSQKTMENDIFIHVLRTQIIQSFYEKKGNLLVLTKNLNDLLEEYIFERFQLFTTKYIQTIDKNTYYFDVYKPLEKMKNDILELIEQYGYQLHKQYDEICDYLKEKEMMMNEKEDFESHSEIMNHLENIEREIFEILKDDGIEPNVDKTFYLGNSDLYVGNPELYIVQQSPLEEESDFIQQSPLEEENDFIQQNILGESSLEKNNVIQQKYLGENIEEKELQENLIIEETIKNELKIHHEFEEKEALYYLENENEIEEFNNTYDQINTNMLDYKIKIKNIKNQIYCFKHDLGRFNENIRIFKNNMQHFMMMMDICNRMCKVK